MGSKLLFDGLSFGIHEKERLGLLGPNGAGKSTLLKILASKEEPDAGEVSRRKGLRLAFVPQEELFSGSLNLLETLTSRLRDQGLELSEIQVQALIALSALGFTDLETKVETLSGGWRKRLSLAVALAQEPDLLILDEPTNHMDWDGILLLEGLLKNFKGSLVLVSHDRAFLNNLCNKTMEINFLYKDGFLAFDGGYEEFLRKKEEYTQTQLSLQDSLSNKARREVEWLRAGVKARTTKSRARAKEAHQLLDDLQALKSRNRAGQSKVRLEIDSAGKRSKKFYELKHLNVGYEERCLIRDLNLLLGPESCIGLLGANGSGKTSLLKVVAGRSQNYTGELHSAENLKVVYFDQKRESLPQEIDLMAYLGDGSDYVVFKDKSVHVAAYASRFLFTSDKMKLKIAQLSGGEQARLLIAKLLLQPADVLILDEPTNDLDIESIEVLEESLSSFPGLILLVSHDRYFLSQLCERYLALDGQGGWQIYADLDQWLKHSALNSAPPSSSPPQVEKAQSAPPPPQKIKLSYKEKRAMETIEQDIEEAESSLAEAQSQLARPEVYSDAEKMQKALQLVDERQKKVEELYHLWETIEQKIQN